jgi:protein-S-isoprenylcysteine O-methyltransferase Ste14
MTDPSDHAHVIIFPPLLFLIAVLAMLGLHWLWPLPIGAESIVFWNGIALIVLGTNVAIWGIRTFKKARTNVSPYQPTTAIVASGPFGLSRNPLYIALISLLLGISLGVGTWWGIIILVPTALVLHYGIVLREERYLEQKFGVAYLEYKAKVRRYL